MSIAAAREVHRAEDDCLRMEADSAFKEEYVDGELRAGATARSRHNIIAANTLVALGGLIRGGSRFAFNSDQRIHGKTPVRFYTRCSHRR